MNIWKISLQNIKSKALYTFLSVFTLALSIALLLGMLQLKTSFKHQMENNLGEIDLVIGAKGSPLQLVLASVLHLDNPTGNISYEDAMKTGKNPMIKSAVPISYGDNYKGFRIVGTTHEFTELYNAELVGGREVKTSMEVVIGNTVAKQLQLKIGDHFLSSHGLVDNDIDVHTEKITVVGILKPTQKVIDRLIVTNLQSVWDVHDHGEEEDNHENNNYDKTHETELNHDEHDHDDEENHKDDDHDKTHETKLNHEEHEEEKEITSLLVAFRNPIALLTFPRQINERTNMQAALPKYELDKLYEYTGIGFKTITWIAYIILIISGMTIFISLYKMVKERAFDLALLRTYGANNFQLIKMVVYEGLTIVCLAFLSGFLLIKTGFYFLFKFIEQDYKQIMLQELSFKNIIQTIALVFIMIILSILLAIYPIIKMNISAILSHEK